MKHIYKVLFALILVVSSCKTTKNVSDNTTLAVLPVKKIIANHYLTNFNQNTVTAKLDAKYSDHKASVSFNIKLRVEKDKAIWMSATKLGVPLAKLLVTPNRVSYYEKINKTYFDGDFSLLSAWLGTELDFNKVQNILLGQAVYDLKKGKYTAEISNNSYMVKPKQETNLFTILFFLDPENFKISKEEISDAAKQQSLSISYPKYQNVENIQFPEEMKVKAVGKNKITTVSIEYNSVEFNKEVNFPFTIPEGYKEISLK